MSTKNNPPFLSIVIPAYNEAENFHSGSLNSVIEYIKKQDFVTELILVNDGSTDGTLGLLESIKQQYSFCKVLSIAHQGKAAAVITGVLSSMGKIVLFTDFDQSTPISQVEKLVNAHKLGADVCIGIRSGRTKKDTLIRKIRSWAFTKFVQTIALPEIRDSQCGFKSFTRHAADKLFNSLQVTKPSGRITGGYMGAFDVELLYLAIKYKYKVSQVQVDWIKYISTRLNIWKEPFKMITDTLLIRLYDFQGKYN